MKKLLIILAVALSTVFAASCKNRQQKADEAQLVEGEMPAEVKAKLDSITVEFKKLGALPVVKKVGALELTEDEKAVKPDYLFDPTTIGNLVTPFQKKNAVFILSVDRMVAQAYEMPLDDYDAAIAKLAVETNLQDIVEILKEGNLGESENFNKLYDAGIAGLGYAETWTMASIALIEQLWFISNNTEKYISMFDDKAAADLTARIETIQDALTTVALYLPSGDIIINAMTPLYSITATNVEELKAQVLGLKSEISAARGAALN